MKEDLYNLYKIRQSEFRTVIDKFKEDDLAGPFLMSPSTSFSVQKNPLMIIGQETNGWTYFVNEIEKQMKTYEEFNLGVNYLSSPFWNITRKVEKVLGNDMYSCAWTNISKFDLNSGRSYGEYEYEISKLDNLLLSELKIIKPKVCLFFTGPSFDGRINRIFDEIEFIEIPDWPIRQFCQLKHPDLPEKTFRSYHPKSLRLRHLESNFINFISKL